MKARRWLTIGIVAGLLGVGLARRGRLRVLHDLVAAQRLGLLYRARQPRERLNIRFKPGSPLGLDVYAPDKATGCPVLVSVHGGGWSLFPRWLFTFGVPPLVAGGAVVVLPDYTLYPHAQYQQMADEVAAAVAWTLEHAAAYGGDPQRVYLQGHSAGAQLAGLVALDPCWLAAYGHTPAELAGLAVSGAVTDVAALHDYWMRRAHLAINLGPQWGAMGRSRAGQQAASPVNHIHPAAPPTLVADSENDGFVPRFIPRGFYEALQAAGVEATWRSYPGKGHADTLFEAALDPHAPLNQDLLDFMARTGAHGSDKPLPQAA